MHMHMFSNTTTKTQPLRLTGVGLLRPGCSSQGRRQVVNRGSKNSGGLGGCGNPPPPPPWQTHWICTTVTSATGRRWGFGPQDPHWCRRRPFSYVVIIEKNTTNEEFTRKTEKSTFGCGPFPVIVIVLLKKNYLIFVSDFEVCFILI